MIVHIKEDESGYKLKMKANSFGAKESENSKNLCRILSDALSARKEWNVRRTTTIDESYGNMYKLQNIVLVGIQGQAASLAVQESDRRSGEGMYLTRNFALHFLSFCCCCSYAMFCLYKYTYSKESEFNVHINNGDAKLRVGLVKLALNTTLQRFLYTPLRIYSFRLSYREKR